MSAYVPLWVKSNFSFLEGASHPDELVEAAVERGLTAMALTDRDGVQGIVRAHVKARELGLNNVRINNAGCLDRCELGPSVVIYPEGIWYSCATREEIDEVLQKHLVQGGRAERLMLQPSDKLPADRGARAKEVA